MLFGHSTVFHYILIYILDQYSHQIHNMEKLHFTKLYILSLYIHNVGEYVTQLVYECTKHALMIKRT